MFGMGFTEILFIAVIAILFLGPDKLPEAMVQIAKFFKSVKNTLNEAKSSFEEEVRIKELREEALGYRQKIEEVSHDIAGFKNAIPNPAAELQDAITSIGGGHYLDDDFLDEIHAEESEEKTSIEEATPTEAAASARPETVSLKASKSRPKKTTQNKTPSSKNLTPVEEA